MTSKYLSSNEKALLLKLIDDHKDVLNDKARNVFKINMKKQAWEVIEESFNSSHICQAPRSVKQLQKFWENWKSATKKELYRTGEELSKLAGLYEKVASVEPEIDEHSNVSTSTPHQNNLCNHFKRQRSETDITPCESKKIVPESSCAVLMTQQEEVNKEKMLLVKMQQETELLKQENEIRRKQIMEAEHKMCMDIQELKFKQQKELHRLKIMSIDQSS